MKRDPSSGGPRLAPGFGQTPEDGHIVLADPDGDEFDMVLSSPFGQLTIVAAMPAWATSYGSELTAAVDPVSSVGACSN